jgi:iron only hydrogenase large subunit-like protein
MSAILSADDLNDFISPGVACIKPIETLPKEDNSNPYDVTTEDKVAASNPAPASISLTDCLACSGCVTSAEAVLVSLQSHTEVLNTLDGYASLDVQALLKQRELTNGHTPIPQHAKLFIASVSPQVRASLGATFGISERRAGYMIEQFLAGPEGLSKGGAHGSRFSYVVDTNQMRETCLVLGADEVRESLQNKSAPRPILTSACPGWICYAEKTHPHVLPHLSKLKSPQALTGTLLKSVLCKSLGIHPSQIWHLAIMPCFDKKLEASREELTNRYWQPDESIDDLHNPVRDVDCVITARELFSLARTRDIQLSSLPLRPISPQQQTPFPDSRIFHRLFPKPRRRPTQSQSQSASAGTSGGYLHHILLTQQSLHPGSKITVHRGRNADVIDYTLVSATGAPLFKAARYYGFRNIQNLVRKLKPAKVSRMPGAAIKMKKVAGGSGIDLAYVEVMACPGGCTNGGGQIRVEDVEAENIDGEGVKGQSLSQKEWLRQVDETYFSAESEFGSTSECEVLLDADGDDLQMSQPSSNSTEDADEDVSLINEISPPQIHAFLSHWSSLVGVPIRKLAYTTFREVVSDVGKNKNMDDSQRIAAIAGMSGGGW